MITAILVDADGVAIKRHDYFSVRYAREFGADPALILSFFKEKYPRCAAGQADLKEELALVINQWGWQGTVEELLTYWFESEREVDEEVIKVVQDWRAQGIRCCLATDQEKYRATYLMETVGLQDAFDEAFFSCDLGVPKDSSEFFEIVLSALEVAPEEVVYFDDDAKNVEIARGLGIDGRVYSQVADLYI